jgi:hypothetical protein
MGQDPKYIVFRSGEDEVVVIFPCFVTHSDMALAMPHLKPISAGFVAIGVVPKLGVQVYGESVSLKLSPRPVDQYLVTRALNLEDLYS